MVSTIEAWAKIAELGPRLAANPSDGSIKLQWIQALLAIGLRTLALHEIQQLASDTRMHAQLVDLIAKAERIDDDLITPEQREQILRTNLGRLGPAIENQNELDRWRASAYEQIQFRCADANIVRVVAGRVDQLQDIRSGLRGMINQAITTLTGRPRGPIVLDGVSPPWILQRLLEEDAQPTTLGFRQQLIVVQPSWSDFLDGMSMIDLGEQIGDDRIEWFVGPDAIDRFSSYIRRHSGKAHSSVLIANPGNQSPRVSEIQQVLGDLDKEEQAHNDTLYKDLADRYSDRDAIHWSARFQRRSEPLRVLIPTSRYTTYLKHSCADLQRALEGIGCQCRVIMEPDDLSVFPVDSYLRALDDFDPDLVVTINYPRSTIAERIPPGVPYVCWVQDAMVHLFNEDCGNAVGEREFFVGMIHPELAGRYAYPQDQMQWMPMPASQSKFAGSASSSPYECEIAWVTHQSEPVDVQCDRLLGMVCEHFPDRAAHFETLFTQIRDGFSEDPARFVFSWLNQLTDECLFPDQDPHAESIIRAHAIHGMVYPIAERLFRHETLRWANELAEKNNWRLRVFGNGWDANPEFAHLAAGPVEHGHQLHECYRSSAVQIHASLHQPMHQRVSECLISGGLPIVRVARDAFAMMNDAAVLEAVESGAATPIYEGDTQTALRATLEDNPSGAKMIECIRRLGLCTENEFAERTLTWPMTKVLAAQQSSRSSAQRANTDRFCSMTDSLFANKPGLEDLIRRAVTDPQWRDAQRAHARSSLDAVYTMEGFAEQVLKFVADSISDQSTAETRPTR